MPTPVLVPRQVGPGGMRAASLAVILFLTVCSLIALPHDAEKPSAPPRTITNSIDMKLVLIPAGKFWMGSPKEEKDRYDSETQHEVEITKPFYMGACEVTQAQYERIMGRNPSYFSAGGVGKDRVIGKNTARFPVDSVPWQDAKQFCDRLSELPAEKAAGRTYRLPTEAEWEYACRAGASGKTAHPFYFKQPFSSLSSSQANFDGNYPYGGAARVGVYLNRTAEVGSYEPNAFGLYDMHGNVAEWCADWYGPYDDTFRDPTGPDTNKEGRRVLRGGSWYDPGRYCRAANHNGHDADDGSYEIGFRVVCVVRGLDNPDRIRVSFARDVAPLLAKRCLACHGPKKKGDLDMRTLNGLLKGGDSGPAIVLGNPEKSPLWMRVDDDSMPPAGKPLTAAQKKLLHDWIRAASVKGFDP